MSSGVPSANSIRSLRRSAALVLAGALLSGPVAMVLVGLVAPQPAWNGVETFAQQYDPVQTIPYLLGYLLLAGFVFFSATCHVLAPEPLRSRTTAALIFTAIYAALVFTNYTIQLGYVPRILHERSEVIGALTMANPSSFAWFLEMFGYAAMGIATWLVAPLFGGSTRGRTVRLLLVANGVVSAIGAACTAAYDEWVFSNAGLISFAAWNLLIVACFLLITIERMGGLNIGTTSR